MMTHSSSSSSSSSSFLLLYFVLFSSFHLFFLRQYNAQTTTIVDCLQDPLLANSWTYISTPLNITFSGCVFQPLSLAPPIPTHTPSNASRLLIDFSSSSSSSSASAYLPPSSTIFLSFLNCTFSNNLVILLAEEETIDEPFGSALTILSSPDYAVSLLFESCTFTNNSFSIQGSINQTFDPLIASGGVFISLLAPSSQIIFNNTQFTANRGDQLPGESIWFLDALASSVWINVDVSSLSSLSNTTTTLSFNQCQFSHNLIGSTLRVVFVNSSSSSPATESGADVGFLFSITGSNFTFNNGSLNSFSWLENNDKDGGITIIDGQSFTPTIGNLISPSFVSSITSFVILIEDVIMTNNFAANTVGVTLDSVLPTEIKFIDSTFFSNYVITDGLVKLSPAGISTVVSFLRVSFVDNRSRFFSIVYLNGETSSFFAAHFQDCRFLRNTASPTSTHYALYVYTKFMEQVGSISIEGCVFEENTGGVYLLSEQRTQFEVENCQFRQNQDTALYLGCASLDYSYASLRNTLFEGQTAKLGAAVAGLRVSLMISNCTFENNVAESEGGAIFLLNSNVQVNNSVFYRNRVNGGDGTGGAMSIDPSNIGTNFIGSCIFEENNAFSSGGAISLEGDDGWTSIYDSLFRGNYASLGGAISTNRGQVSVYNTNFIDQKGSLGVVYSKGTTLLMVGGIFVNNTVTAQSGGLYLIQSSQADINNVVFFNNTAGETGGAVVVTQSRAVFVGCTFDSCGATSSGTDGGVLIASISEVVCSSCVFKNNQGSQVSVISSSDGTLTLSDTNLEANNGGFSLMDGELYISNSSLSGSLLFSQIEGTVLIENSTILDDSGSSFGNQSLVSIVDSTINIMSHLASDSYGFLGETVINSSTMIGYFRFYEVSIIRDTSFLPRVNPFYVDPVFLNVFSQNFTCINCSVLVVSQIEFSAFRFIDSTFNTTVELDVSSGEFTSTSCIGCTITAVDSELLLTRCVFTTPDEMMNTIISLNASYVTTVASAFCFDELAPVFSCSESSRIFGDILPELAPNCVVELQNFNIPPGSSLISSVCYTSPIRYNLPMESDIIGFRVTIETLTSQVLFSSSNTTLAVTLSNSNSSQEFSPQVYLPAVGGTASLSLFWNSTDSRYPSPQPNRVYLFTIALYNSTLSEELFNVSLRIDYVPHSVDLTTSTVMMVNLVSFSSQDVTVEISLRDQWRNAFVLSSTESLNGLSLLSTSGNLTAITTATTSVSIPASATSPSWKPLRSFTVYLVDNSVSLVNGTPSSYVPSSSVWIINTYWIYGLVGVVCLLIVLWPTVYFVRLLIRYRRKVAIQKDLLAERDEEITTLTEVWNIDPSEIKWEAPISSGSFGEVWKAEWREGVVAVKKLHKWWLEGDDSTKMEFENECKFLRSVRHANVVLFIGAGSLEDGTPFLVTEYIARGSLFSLLKQQAELPHGEEPLTWPEKVRFCLDTAKGMSYLHSRDSVHRDLKPQNLLVTRGMTVKIADFGTAKLCSQGLRSKHSAHPTIALQYEGTERERLLSSAPRSGGGETNTTAVNMTTFIGTVLYRAPEIQGLLKTARRKTDYGKEVDVYSFGICLWVIGHGDGTEPYGDLHRESHIDEFVAQGNRPPVPSEAAGWPQDWILLMKECWDGSPKRRPSFDQILKRLEALNV